MHILVMRHGDAVEDAPGLGDGGRWLTGKGRRVTREVAVWLAAKDDRRPTEIWTSPLVRAVQTAEIVAEHAELDDEVSVLGALSTSGDPRDVLQALARRHGRGPIAVVGHEPSLSTLARTLLGDVAWPGFKKSGVLAVQWSGHGAAKFEFLLIPKDLRVIDDVDKLAGG
jgi:phosphohistidine phosphatase